MISIGQFGRSAPIFRRFPVNHRSSRCVSAASVMSDLRDIPSPKGLPVFGTVLDILVKGGAGKLHEYADFRHKQLGTIFRDKVGPTSAVFLCDPEDMRSVFASEGKYPVHVLPPAWTLYNETYKVSRGLFFMDGEEWLQNRKVMNKLMLKGDLSWLDEACEEVGEDLVERWSCITQGNGILPELETQLYRWSIDVMLSVILGVKEYKSAKTELNSLVDSLARNVYLIFQTSAKLQLVPVNLAATLRLPSWRSFVKAMDESLKVTTNLVTTLIDKYPEGGGLLSKMKKENVHASDMVKILTDFIIAAGDTTAYSMEWLLYCVGTNKAVQEKARELLATGDSSGYLRNAVKESLRLYPVAPFITRIITKRMRIREYNIPPGTLVLLSIYTSGRDPNVFENPDLYWPERWSRDGSKNLVVMQQATLPFGLGSRSCIGKKVAEMQLQKTIGKIIKNFDVEIANKDEIQMVLKMVAVPSKPLKLKLKKL